MNRKKKELKFPANWETVRNQILKKEITVSEGCKRMDISKTDYYRLLKMAKENSEHDGLAGKTELTPSEYFQELKDSVKILEDSELTAAFASAMHLLEGYQKTGQEKSCQKLQFLMETILQEKKLVDLGIDTYVYRSDVERFISKVEKKTVKVIELRNYERPLPDEIQEVVALTDGIFTERYVVFTDYTGKVEKEVEKERRDKDPILFGVFKDSRNHPLSERMYFLGDWIDDQCDLTLDSLIDGMHQMTGEDIEHRLQNLQSIKDFEEALARVKSKEEDIEDQKLDPQEDTPRMSTDDPREFREMNKGESIAAKVFRQVRSILGKQKK